MQTSQLSPFSELGVPDPEIPVVMNLETGDYLTLAAVVGTDREIAIQRRMAIKEGQLLNKPLYACSECLVPVSLLMHPESRRFYFKHTLEDGRCSAVTRGQLSQKEISAQRYNGTKESNRHRRMKALVEESLRADPRFSDIQPEKRWTGPFDGRWRQPDVQAVYDAQDGSAPIKVAFEIQLSTTYLDVIAERRVFYRNQGGLLFWIFAEFNESGRRLMQDDVFYNNNQNAFLVSEETTVCSKARAEFHLNCAWVAPQGASALQRKMVSFRDLVLDKVRQQAYYFDFEGEKRATEREAKKKRHAALAPLRDEFEAFWIARDADSLTDMATWGKLRWKFKQAGIEFPRYPSHLPSALLYALYSAKHGRCISWDYPTLVQLAHWVVAKYPQYLQLFRKALYVYDRGGQLEAEDTTGKWREKAAKYKNAIKVGDLKYAPDTKHDEIVAILFPELLGEDGRLL